ncbi:protein EMSY-LIKE 2-like isoform X2 [Magnolia sinica]|uniref:protein EMSY-LIKE 2-like isoform X2 n=1 Tax=Magnolia sinica TaxID=86752 RepID=UPI0026584852|nr:protein EMSY-LIKE 2-like isoform X2 [Magnolia sinica]
MEYRKLDSGGTNDPLALQHVNRNANREQFSGAMRASSITVPRGMDLTEMGFQMHCLEMEAYNAILRAFFAQSDGLTWEREGLISELRKELRISDVEHREFLVKVKSDDSVKNISRECHNDVARKQELPSNMMNAPLKKLKTAHISVSPSPRCLPCVQPSTAATPSPLAMQWGDGAAINSNQENFGQGLNSVGHSRQALSMVKGRASMVVHMKKRFSDMGIENFNSGSNHIQILATDKLIDEVETVLREHPKPSQVEKEHEKELSEALEKVGGVLDDDDSPDHLQQPYSHQYMPRFEHGTHRPVFGQVDRVKGYFPDGFGRDLADRSGIPRIDLQGSYS